MKYLDKKFTIYPSVPKNDGFFGWDERERARAMHERMRNSVHEFVDVGGMCRWCALGQEGHDKWVERIKSKSGGAK